MSRINAHSPYMQWAKLNSSAEFNLANSGIASYPLAGLGVKIEQIEINGPTVYGYEPLLAAIAKRYGVDKDCVVTAAGTSMANYLALAAVTEPGDEALIEHPTYELLVSTALYLGLKVKRFTRPRESDFQPDLTDLERKLSRKTKLVVLANLHNPSGALTPQSTLKKISALARVVGARILVDEVYLEMLYESKPQTSFHIAPDQFLVTNSLTKAYGLSGLRCGWVLASPDVARRIWDINDLHSATAAFPAEALSVIAFEKLDEIASAAQASLDRNRKLLRKFLDVRPELDCVWPEYGTVVFPRLKVGDVNELCVLLRDKYQTTVVPGKFFEMPDHFRIGVGGATESVEGALDQLGPGLEAYVSSCGTATAR